MTLNVTDKCNHLCSAYKYLGLELDKNLNWEEHTNAMCKKIRQKLGVFQRIRPYLDEKTALKLYNAFVMPAIDYCDMTYSSCSNKSEKKILQTHAQRWENCTECTTGYNGYQLH